MLCFELSELDLCVWFHFYDCLSVLEPCLTDRDLHPLVVCMFLSIFHSIPRASRCYCASSLPWEFVVSICSVNFVIASLHSFGGFLSFYFVI